MKLVLSTLIIFSISIHSQVITVLDEATRNPLELVSIYNSDPNRSILTNSNGKVDISKIEKDRKIIFRLLGYEKSELSFSVIEKNNFVVLMKATTISLDNVVVTANRWEENKSEIPNTIEVITPTRTTKVTVALANFCCSKRMAASR